MNPNPKLKNPYTPRIPDIEQKEQFYSILKDILDNIFNLRGARLCTSDRIRI